MDGIIASIKAMAKARNDFAAALNTFAAKTRVRTKSSNGAAHAAIERRKGEIEQSLPRRPMRAPPPSTSWRLPRLEKALQESAVSIGNLAEARRLALVLHLLRDKMTDSDEYFLDVRPWPPQPPHNLRKAIAIARHNFNAIRQRRSHLPASHWVYSIARLRRTMAKRTRRIVLRHKRDAIARTCQDGQMARTCSRCSDMAACSPKRVHRELWRHFACDECSTQFIHRDDDALNSERQILASASIAFSAHSMQSNEAQSKKMRN